MAKYRRAAKVDANQPEIVKELRGLGISVQPGHDDILVGHNGKTYWFEIKIDEKADVKASQTKILNEWKGHYQIVWSVEQILEALKS